MTSGRNSHLEWEKPSPLPKMAREGYTVFDVDIF